MPEPTTSPRLASTVALLRDGSGGLETLLTRRPAAMAFAGGLHVFPGGAVDVDDQAPELAARAGLSPEAAAERLGGGLEPDVALAHHVAAIRELFEEVGVLLARSPRQRPPDPVALDAARRDLLAGRVAFAGVLDRLGLEPDVAALHPLGHWITPPSLPRRFDTRFFAAELSAGAVASAAGSEVAGLDWLRPAEALERLAAGRAPMLPPTAVTLDQLDAAGSIDQLAALAPRAGAPPAVEVVEPWLVRVATSGAGGLPGRPSVTWLAGLGDIVAVDPGDPAPDVIELLAATAAARGGRIVSIALTSDDPDRAAGAEGLGLATGASIAVGPGGGRRVVGTVVEAAVGEVVAAGDGWLVRIGAAAPGGRPGAVGVEVRGPDGRVTELGLGAPV